MEGDTPALVELLLRGLPGRSREFWLAGLDRMKNLNLPPNIPRYGFVLESDGALVGVIMMIHAQVDGLLRCNLSSWYVEPKFRALAALLVNVALRRCDITYINISPNPSTWNTIETQGFRRYVSGQFVSIPCLNITRRCRIRPIESTDDALLLDHTLLDCICFVLETKIGSYPFVFMRDTWAIGPMSVQAGQLLYCEDVSTYVRFAGPIGRYLMRRGIPIVLHDANAPEPGLLGYFSSSAGPRYYRGLVAPRLGDLAYSEWVVFGAGLRGSGRRSVIEAISRIVNRMLSLSHDA